MTTNCHDGEELKGLIEEPVDSQKSEKVRYKVINESDEEYSNEAHISKSRSSVILCWCLVLIFAVIGGIILVGMFIISPRRRSARGTSSLPRRASTRSSSVTRDLSGSPRRPSTRSSNYTCFDEESNYPLCMLHNVCNDGKGSWVMYGLHFNFNLISDERCDNPKSRQHFKFTDLPGSDISFQPGVTIFHSPYYDQNFGHVLGDDIWSIWQALYFFNHWERSVVLHDGNINHPSTKLYELLNVTLRRYDKTSFECYENVIMGWTQLGYARQPGQNCELGSRGERPKWQGKFQTAMRAFREHSYKFLDINRLKPRSQVTIIVKPKDDCEHCIVWENVDECIDALKIEFTDTRFEKVSWDGMPMKDQVQIMHDTEVLIGLPGSNLMNAIWLNDDTGIIYVNRKPDPNNHGNEYIHWYKRMGQESDGWIDNMLLGSEHVQNLMVGNLIVDCNAVTRVLQGFREKKASISKEA